MQELQRSPSKWKTEQRDTYRYFVESPKKKENNLESITLLNEVGTNAGQSMSA